MHTRRVISIVSLIIAASCGTALAQPAKSQIVVFGTPKAFVSADKSFSVLIPDNWKVEEKSTPGESIVQAGDPTGNSILVIHVLPSTTVLGEAGLPKLLTLFLDQTTSTFKDFSKGEPIKQGDGSFAVYFKFNEMSGADKIAVTGDAFAQEEKGKVALIFFAIPSEQYDDKKAAAYDMINSFKILTTPGS